MEVNLSDEPEEERSCRRCGHVFDTRTERVDHEQQGDKGIRTLCPCGDVCAEGAP